MGAITGSVLVCMLTFNPGPIRTLLRRSYGSEANSHQSERRRKRIKKRASCSESCDRQQYLIDFGHSRLKTTGEADWKPNFNCRLIFFDFF